MRIQDPKKIVSEGYDLIASRYSEWAGQTGLLERTKYTSLILKRLQTGDKLLELGCGTGIPTTRRLAQHLDVTGVDISPRNIELARHNVPKAELVCGDMTALDLPDESFDGVSAFYSIIHVPRDEHLDLFKSITGWLKPGGLFVATLSASDTEAGYETDWLGAPMYWSGYDGETNQRLVKEAGLSIISAREEVTEEFGKPVTFLWVVAEKPE
jgi:ubiquinone/menaquinone biosynthesis C-methylase UbiE